MANKAQGRRGKKLSGKYAAQYDITIRNKARRAKKRARIAASPKTAARAVARKAKFAQRRASKLARKAKPQAAPVEVAPVPAV